MKRNKATPRQPPPHDYALALRNAVSWLGDRYLLAQPAERRVAAPEPYFVEPRRWHEKI